ncbi:hexapeptide transferase [Caldovatus sediminis]|uniref:Hexapeptide transferase n=1 Tax=Caldovatus sediminis TaxID=2041189 RepID=A0A8J2ZDA7_9PROT|nr:NeuD/PglB/VioB family sugar acetyltransferase [Caldovatus sediminis]GGG43842.1 hexapeptide transferase [Caldovatus sediminis]
MILGAGGHGKAVLDLLLTPGGSGRFEVVGLVDAVVRPPAAVLGRPVLGDEGLLPALRAAGVTDAAPAIGDNGARAAAGARLGALGFALPALVHPAAVVGRGAEIGAGAVVMARVTIGPEARIGPLALINTGAIVEHDCVVGEAAHVAPGAVLTGGVRVGAHAFVGAGAVVRPRVRIGAAALVGAGAAVVDDVPDGARVTGVPARAGG